MRNHPDSSPRGMKPNRSIAKAAALLRALSGHPDGATVVALAARTELPRATASRLLATLATEGLVQRLPDNDRYILGHELARLGRAADPDRTLVLAIRPVLEELAATLRETITLAVPRPGPGYEVVCQIDAPRAIRAHDWSIDPQPLHASAAGKLVLSQLTATELDDVLGQGLVRLTAATIVDRERLRSD